MLAGGREPPASMVLFAWNSVNGGSGIGVTFATRRGDHALAISGILGNPGGTGFKRVALRARGDSGRIRSH